MGNKIFRQAFLPGIMVPEKKEYLLTADMALKVGICDGCNLAYHPHPIDQNGYHWCTVLLHDAIKPSWKLSDVAHFEISPDNPPFKRTPTVTHLARKATSEPVGAA